MSKLRVKLNRAGVRELLRSQEMMGICVKQASAAQSRLGAGYEVTTAIGKNRVNASIAAVTPKSRRDNARNQTILKALGGK